MAKSYRERIGDLLDTLRTPLSNYGIDRLKARFRDDWREAALEYLGDRRTQSDDPREWDIQAWINFYISAWNALFSEVLGPGDRSRLFELKHYRNKWAHQESFDFDNTYRAHDHAQLLLEAMNSSVAEQVAAVKEQIQREKYSQPNKKAIVRIKSNPQGNLKPWRNVAIPHEDVQKGTFSASEFAADLWEAHKAVQGDSSARAPREYRDANEFFSRTYITEGLGNLLRAALKRLTAAGGEPVVQLQTNFGGGKTHSMLALYHLCGSEQAANLPGVDAFLKEEGLAGPSGVRRVVIVGNKMQPGAIDEKPDGTEVRTLWGEIAWQLGGKDGYDIVRTADEQATSPGDSLTELLKQFAPAVILIDEWVAYARQLYNRYDLKECGSFDTQMTFAQTLTEAAKIVPGVVLVVSLPASKTETGSQAGQETLERLAGVVGRIESTWQPATRDEAYEIVRRRLFETSLDTVARGGTVRAMVEMSRKNPSHFPAYVREQDYQRRLENTYPIHPELFDDLYRTWSTIPGFQQTRGVLRLMAAVIHSLWDNGDMGLMIMPGLVPLDDPRVRSEFTKFLGTGWNNIIEAEIDGQGSLAAQIDRENANLGALGAARRAARTLFLATSPLQSANQPGINENQLKLGCSQPGEKPAIFGDAASYLGARSAHLYNEGGNMRYSEQPTLRRLAEDRKAQLDEAELIEALEAVLRKPPHNDKGDFARLHIAPHSPADVNDSESVALVVIPPSETYTNGGEEAPALTFANQVLDSRGAAPRIYKNTVVFAAADSARAEELLEAVGWWSAWSGIVKHIHESHPSMANVTQNQRHAAETDLENARKLVDARIPETYQWLLLPTQKSPQEPLRIAAHRMRGDRPVAVKAAHFLTGKQWLMAQMDGPALRLEIDQIPLWKDGAVAVDALCEYFARYPYLPRVASSDTTIEAVRDGVSSLTWSQTFAWARAYDESAGRYVELTAGAQISASVIRQGLLVHPDVAENQFNKDAEKAEEAREGAAAETGSEEGAGTGARSDGAGRRPEGGGTEPSPGHPTPEREHPKRRFFASVALDPAKPATQMGTILEEVLAHLSGSGAQVKLTLDIEATHPEGFPEQTQRIVRENASALRFDQGEFEEE